jgi:hypothetical protein
MDEKVHLRLVEMLEKCTSAARSGCERVDVSDYLRAHRALDANGCIARLVDRFTFVQPDGFGMRAWCTQSPFLGSQYLHLKWGLVAVDLAVRACLECIDEAKHRGDRASSMWFPALGIGEVGAVLKCLKKVHGLDAIHHEFQARAIVILVTPRELDSIVAALGKEGRCAYASLGDMFPSEKLRLAKMLEQRGHTATFDSCGVTMDYGCTE